MLSDAPSPGHGVLPKLLTRPGAIGPTPASAASALVLCSIFYISCMAWRMLLQEVAALHAPRGSGCVRPCPSCGHAAGALLGVSEFRSRAAAIDGSREWHYPVALALPPMFFARSNRNSPSARAFTGALPLALRPPSLALQPPALGLRPPPCFMLLKRPLVEAKRGINTNWCPLDLCCCVSSGGRSLCASNHHIAKGDTLTSLDFTKGLQPPSLGLHRASHGCKVMPPASRS